MTFPPGETERTIRFATVADDVDEGVEALEVEISADRNQPINRVARSTARGRILNRTLPVVTVAADADTVTEGAAAVFTLTRRNGDMSAALEVPVTVTDAGSALTDAPPSSVTFGAGDATAVLRLGTRGDDDDNPDAAVTLALRAGADHALGSPSSATVTVRDDDLPVVTVATDAAEVFEGVAAAFTLTRVGDLTVALEAPVEVTDAGSTLANAAPASVTFAIGDATAALRLDTRDDAVDEPDAQVTLTLQAGAGHALGDPSSATVTVRDDDGLPEVTIADAAPVTEGGTLEFPVRLSHAGDTRIVVEADYRFTGAAGGAVTVTVAFAPGDLEETISVATVDDGADDGEETVEVALAAPDPALAVLGAASRATGRVLDDDGLSEVTAAAVADAITEGEAAAFTLTRANGDVSAALTVPVTVTDAGGVLASASPSSVTFGAGAATATLRLGTLDDTVDEPDAAVTLTLTAGAAWHLGTPSRATVTVRDDERPVVTVASAADAVAEGEDVVFTLTRVGDRSGALEVSVQVTEAGSALADTPPASATFQAGDATTTLRLGTEDDTRRDNPDPVVTLTLVDGVEYDLGAPSRATVTVRDNDRSTEVSIADAAPVTEGGTLEFPITLTRPHDVAITVLYQLNQDPAATAERSDYTDVTVAFARGEFRFAPGEVRKVVSLRTVDDDSYEGEETVSVDILYSQIFQSESSVFVATGRILDNDIPVVTVAADAAAVTEGEDAVFTLTRTGDVSGALDVPVTVTDAGAKLAGAPSASVSFGAGDATATLSVGTDDDEADEPDTVVTVTLADGADHDLGAPSEATVTVRDDDLPELSIADAAPVPEGGTLEFVLSLTSPAAAEFPVTWQISGATAGVDYEGPSLGVLTFPTGRDRAYVPAGDGRRQRLRAGEDGYGRSDRPIHSTVPAGATGQQERGHGPDPGRRASPRDGGGGHGHGHRRRGGGVHPDADGLSAGRADGVLRGDGRRRGAGLDGADRSDLPGRQQHGARHAGDG